MTEISTQILDLTTSDFSCADDVLRPGAPQYLTRKPDVDNLLKFAMDALQPAILSVFLFTSIAFLAQYGRTNNQREH